MQEKVNYLADDGAMNNSLRILTGLSPLITLNIILFPSCFTCEVNVSVARGCCDTVRIFVT